MRAGLVLYKDARTSAKGRQFTRVGLEGLCGSSEAKTLGCLLGGPGFTPCRAGVGVVELLMAGYEGKRVTDGPAENHFSRRYAAVRIGCVAELQQSTQ